MFARFRSHTRDKQANLARVSTIRAATSAAMLTAESEAAGLKRRVEEVRVSIALALGNEDGIYFEREAEDEKGITLLEAQLLTGERRLQELDLQLQKLAQISRLLDEISGEPVAV